MDIQQQKQLKILLIGDTCEDVYHYGVCERMSPEAPVPVFKETSRAIRLGMSSNVKLNLESFGISVEHFYNVETIRKHRFIEENYNQQLFRYDEGENHIIEAFEPVVLSDDYDAIVISDYNKGFVTPESFRRLQSAVDSSIPIFVDSKKRDLRMFGNCFIKINETESFRATTDPAQDIIVTLGSRGAKWREQVFETREVDVYDVCGAGDVFLSSFVYGYLKHGDVPKAIQIANMCASLSVTKMGTYILTKGDINDLCI